MVERPAEFTVPELINALPSYTIPVTLVCAGGLLCSAVICHPAVAWLPILRPKGVWL